MSVPRAKRGTGRLAVLTKALDLTDYTVTICKNEKNFPKRERWILTNRIVNTTLDLVSDIRKGNTVRVENDGDYLRRRTYQQSATENAEILLTYIDIAYRNLHLDSDRVEHWTGLVLEVEALISAWRKSDRDTWHKKKAQKEQVIPPQGDN